MAWTGLCQSTDGLCVHVSLPMPVTRLSALRSGLQFPKERKIERGPIERSKTEWYYFSSLFKIEEIGSSLYLVSEIEVKILSIHTSRIHLKREGYHVKGRQSLNT